MIKIEITGIEDFLKFISMFKDPETEKLIKMTEELTDSTKSLVDAENKDSSGVKQHGTGSY